jgi:hypothetical protein
MTRTAAAAAAVVLACLAWTAAGPVTVSRGQVLGWLTDAAAVACVLAAAAILAAVHRKVSRATGAHTDIVPGDETRSGPAPEPAPAVVPGWHPAYTLRPEQPAEEPEYEEAEL